MKLDTKTFFLVIIIAGIAGFAGYVAGGMTPLSSLSFIGDNSTSGFSALSLTGSTTATPNIFARGLLSGHVTMATFVAYAGTYPLMPNVGTSSSTACPQFYYNNLGICLPQTFSPSCPANTSQDPSMIYLCRGTIVPSGICQTSLTGTPVTGMYWFSNNQCLLGATPYIKPPVSSQLANSAIIIYDSSGTHVVTTTKTNANGDYFVTLYAGTYVIKAKGSSGLLINYYFQVSPSKTTIFNFAA